MTNKNNRRNIIITSIFGVVILVSLSFFILFKSGSSAIPNAREVWLLDGVFALEQETPTVTTGLDQKIVYSALTTSCSVTFKGTCPTDASACLYSYQPTNKKCTVALGMIKPGEKIPALKPCYSLSQCTVTAYYKTTTCVAQSTKCENNAIYKCIIIGERAGTGVYYEWYKVSDCIYGCTNGKCTPLPQPQPITIEVKRTTEPITLAQAEAELSNWEYKGQKAQVFEPAPQHGVLKVFYFGTTSSPTALIYILDTTIPEVSSDYHGQTCSQVIENALEQESSIYIYGKTSDGRIVITNEYSTDRVSYTGDRTPRDPPLYAWCSKNDKLIFLATPPVMISKYFDAVTVEPVQCPTGCVPEGYC